MQLSLTQFILTLSGIVILGSGCASPSINSAKPTARMPGPPVHAVTPGSSAGVSAGLPQARRLKPGLQQTSQPGSPTVAGSASAPGVTQVGYQVESCQSGACGGPCCGSACGSSCGDACNTTPHGFAPPMGPQNAYGIDGQEFLCDGGDHSPGARVRRDDTISGLQPEDTVVHYTTEAGDIEVKASNRVCVYAPRFKSVRKITGALSGEHSVGLAGIDRQIGANNLEVNEGGVVIGESLELGHAEVARSLDAMRHRDRGVPVEGILQIEETTDVLTALVGLTFDQINELRDDQKALVEELALAAIAWTANESLEVAIEDLKAPVLTRDQSVEGLTIYEFPDAGRLQICKLADRPDAKPGDIVNFAIRVENVGDSPVNQVVLTDNLTTRLEYVAESQTCSAGAEFETVPNEGESLQLIWKLTDNLRVGESATIRFRCRVR